MSRWKLFAVLIFLLVLNCAKVIDAVGVEGFGDSRLLDQNVIHMVKKFRYQIQENEDEVFIWFKLISYKKQLQQIVTSTTYKIKVMYDDGYMVLKVFQPELSSGEETLLVEYETHATVCEISVHIAWHGAEWIKSQPFRW